MSLKLPYGFKDGRLCHVEDVERGLKCACVCPCCDGALIARKGPIKVAHFAHHREDCGKGLETALHMMAKEILEERREIALPKPAIPTKLYSIEKVSLERRLGDIIPDVTIYIEGQLILVEVVVTHGIDEWKSKAIWELGISTLIIDLSDETRAVSKEDLASIVVEGTDNKRWEFNRRTVELKRRRVEASRRLKVTRLKMTLEETLHFGITLHVAPCPIKAQLFYGHSFANVIHDCWYCEFLVDEKAQSKEYEAENPDLSHDARERLLNDPEPDGYILCDGHITIQRVGLAKWKAQRAAEEAERVTERAAEVWGTWSAMLENSRRRKRRMDK